MPTSFRHLVIAAVGALGLVAMLSGQSAELMIRDERGGGDSRNVQFANRGFDASLAGKIPTVPPFRIRTSMPTVGHTAVSPLTSRYTHKLT